MYARVKCITYLSERVEEIRTFRVYHKMHKGVADKDAVRILMEELDSVLPKGIYNIMDMKDD